MLLAKLSMLLLIWGSMNGSLFALQIDFEHPCSGHIAATSFQMEADGISLGALTVNALEEAGLSYLGSETGLSSILNTPTGLDAIEIISDTDMKAYGWCFLVDGQLADEYASDISSVQVKKVEWFFGYAAMENGKWVSMCEKLSFDPQKPQPFFCPLPN